MKVRLMKTPSHARIFMAGAALSIVLLGFPAQAFYNPSTGRWLNRDPVEEAGGINVVALHGNRAIDFVDRLGLEDLPVTTKPGSETLGGQVPGDLWKVVFWNGDLAKAPAWSGVTAVNYGLRVTDVDFAARGGGCYCCKLSSAETKIEIKTTLNAWATTFTPSTLPHEGVHAWTFYQMGTYAFNTWIYQHKEYCLILLDGWLPAGLNDVRKVPRTKSDCQAALQGLANALITKLDKQANSNNSELGSNVHRLMGPVGWTAAGQDAVANWFWPWLNNTFPGGCLGDGAGPIDY
jgi:hypothetical protein